MDTLPTLRDKIAGALRDNLSVDECECIRGESDAADAIMSIIKNHIEWSDPDVYGHMYSDCDVYEITDEYALYDFWGRELSQHETLDEAKQAAQAHKEWLR